MQTLNTSQRELYTEAQSARTMNCDDLLTVGEVARLLKVPPSWVYERTRRRGIDRLPHFKIGKYLRFSEGEIVAWLERIRGI